MRTGALIKRIFRQMFRDKRTLALLFLAPLLILSLMYLLFNGEAAEPRLGVVNSDSNTVKILEKQDIDVILFESASSKTIKEKELDGLLDTSSEKWNLILENSDPAVSKALQMKINQAAVTLKSGAQKQQSAIPNTVGLLHTSYLYGSSDTSAFDKLSPLLVGFFVFFFVFLISGIGLLRERTTGTLDRLMSTPIRRWEIVTGYLIGYGVFAVIQTIIVVIYSITVLDMIVAGSIGTVVLINLVLALVALSLGILLSAFAASEFQMIQFIPIVIVPQVFFSGIFPMDGMAAWLQNLGRLMPISYGANALVDVMYKGFGLKDIWSDLLILLIFSLIFILLNIVALKKYRTL